jgi:hypothetical protein
VITVGTADPGSVVPGKRVDISPSEFVTTVGTITPISVLVGATIVDTWPSEFVMTVAGAELSVFVTIVFFTVVTLPSESVMTVPTDVSTFETGGVIVDT